MMERTAKALRSRFESWTIEELQDALAVGVLNSAKSGIARNVLETKLDQRREEVEAEREQRREQGEVAVLRAKIADLEHEVRDRDRQLRDQSKTLSWTRIGVLTTSTIAAAALVVATVAAWNDGLGALFHWAVAAVKGTR